MKEFFVLVLGKTSQNHLQALFDIAQNNEGFHGFEVLPFDGHENSDEYTTLVSEKIDSLYKMNIEPVIIKGSNIHTEDYIRPIIRYFKKKHPKTSFFLSHCAVFNNFILTDGALLTKYTKENIEMVIANAVQLRDKIFAGTSKTIAMLNAGGDTNPNTAPDYWLKIFNNLEKETSSYKLEMSQLDVALNAQIRLSKLDSLSSLPSIIIPSSINEGNSIWKTMTVIAKESLAGIVVGLPMYIGLTSRTDSEESIYKTLRYLIKLMNFNNTK